MWIGRCFNMKISHLDLNLLKVFDAIFKHRSLTLAGDALSVSQPAISHALRRLRAAYGDELFFRTPSGMMPTPFSKEIARDIGAALNSIKSTIDASTVFDPVESTRHLRFHMGDLAELLVTPVLLRLMDKSAPNMSMKVVQISDNTEIINSISTGVLDFAIERLISLEQDKTTQANNVQSQHIWDDQYVCAVRRGHPKYADMEEISLDEYLAAKHICAWGSQNTMSDIDVALSKLGLERRIVFQSQYFLDAPTAANCSDFVLTIPRSFATFTDLKVFDLPFEAPNMTYYMYFLSENYADTGYNWVKDLVLKVFDDCKAERQVKVVDNVQ